jgi:hypothetical protein
MITLETDLRALRMRGDFEHQGKPRGYRSTYRIGPDGSDTILFQCDVVGHVASRETRFVGPDGDLLFSMKPNRKILPSRWRLKASDGSDIGYLDQKLLGRGAWAAFDATGREIFCIIDPAPQGEQIASRMLGGATTAYAFVTGDQSIATTRKEPRERIERGGLRGFLKTLVAKQDWVVRFADGQRPPDVRFVGAAMLLLKDITVTIDQAA